MGEPAATTRSAASRALGLLAVGLLLVSCASKEPAVVEPEPAWPGQDPIEKIDAFIAEVADPNIDRSDPRWKTRVPRPPFVRFDPSRKYYWFLNTDAGTLKIELKPEWSPNHVSTAIYLTRLGFYDGLTFHRVIPKFMAQGGDPLGDGSGSPGFRIAGEFHKKAKHAKRGVVSAANRGPRTDGSQFFILFKEAEHLDGKHTVYGQLVEGLGTLRTLETLGTKDGEPREIVQIRRASIVVE